MAIVEEAQGRQYCSEISDAWSRLEQLLQSTEAALLQGLSQQADVSLDERIVCIECSHARIQSVLSELPTVYARPEDAAARHKELQVPEQKKYDGDRKVTHLYADRHCSASASGS